MFWKFLISLCLSPISFIVSKLFSLIPAFASVSATSLMPIVNVLKYAFVFVSPSVFHTFIFSIVSWYMARLGWAVFEWIYKKIPGVS